MHGAFECWILFFYLIFLNVIDFLCFLLVLLCLFGNYGNIFQIFDNIFEITPKIWKFAILFLVAIT